MDLPQILPGVPPEFIAYQERRLAQLKELRDQALSEDAFSPGDIERITEYYRPHIDMLAEHLEKLKAMGPGFIIERK